MKRCLRLYLQEDNLSLYMPVDTMQPCHMGQTLESNCINMSVSFRQLIQYDVTAIPPCKGS